MILRALKTVIILSGLAAFLLLGQPDKAVASETENIRGWASTGQNGYIIFNCLDDGYAGRFPIHFPFYFNVEPCSMRQHGVNLDANNNFSGSAWNQAKGYVNFFSSTIPVGLDESFRTKCNAPCTQANSCIACYNEDQADQQVYGYMVVSSTQEWIRLDNLAVSPHTQITNYNAASPGIFSGYATSTAFGQISFNCTNDNSCTTNPYAVKIGPLEIRQLIAPNWAAEQACSAQGANNAILGWNRRSGEQKSFEVIVNNVNSTTSPIYYSGLVNSNTATQHPIYGLAYNTPYYWWLRVWDKNGVATPWRQFNTNGTKDWITDNYQGGQDTRTFISYKHEFPKPLFTWTPEEIVIATTSNRFISNSTYSISGNNQTPCVGSACIFKWTTSDGAASILTDTAASTSIEFTKATNTVVTLSAKDAAGYICSTSTVLNVNYALPLWKEIKP